MKTIDTDKVIAFLNNSTNHEIAFMLNILADRIMVYNGRDDKGTMVVIDEIVDCSLNGMMFQLNSINADDQS